MDMGGARVFRNKWVLLFIAAVIIAGIVYIRSQTKSIPVQYVIIKKQNALSTVLANGKIAGSKVFSLSFQKSGVIAGIYAREGSTVKMGDAIIILDNKEEQNLVTQCRNAVNVARINLQKLSTTDSAQAAEQVNQAQTREALAKKQLDRADKLLQESAIAQTEYEKIKNDYDLAASQARSARDALASLTGNQKQLLQAQAAQAVAQLDAAQISYARTVIRAPEDGKIVKRFVNVGETVAPGSPVSAFLPADSTTHVELAIDEDQIQKISVGQKALVSLIAEPQKTFDAKVRDILPLIDAARGTATVQLAINGTIPHILPDQTVSAQIVIGTIPDALILEQRFIQFSQKDTTVFVLRRNKANRRMISVQDLGNAQFAVTAGLAEGDTLLLAPALSDGDRVRLKE